MFIFFYKIEKQRICCFFSLQHLLSKPTLRNSELLYNFLTQPDEFTLPNGEIILAKVFKVVPRALRIEVGLNYYI